MKPFRERSGATAKAMALAAGLSMASCTDPAKERMEHPPLTQHELIERYPNPSWSFPRLIPGDHWLYLQESPLSFLRVHNSPQTHAYFDSLYEHKQKAVSEAPSEEEAKRIADFYDEKIRRDFSGSPDCVRVE